MRDRELHETPQADAFGDWFAAEAEPAAPGDGREAATLDDAELNLVDLILLASEWSEDEGEVRDHVDALFERHRDDLADLRDEFRSQA